MAIQRVLVIKLGALGDIVFADGALRDIREHHPHARITLLTRHNYATLMRRCPWVDTVVEDGNAPRWRLDQMLALRERVFAGAYDIVYDLQNSRRTRFYRQWLSRGDAVWSQQEPDAARQGAVAFRHAAQLRLAGIDTRHAHRPSPDWIADDVDALLHEAGVERPFVALLPGSSARHPDKRWPHYAECSRHLHSQGLNVVTIPGIEEADMGPGFAGVVLKNRGRVLNLHELAGVLKAADYVVGNDSGPTHLAACLGTRCVALFDADSPARITTGIDDRNAVCLTAQPLRSIPVEAAVSAVLDQGSFGIA